MSDRKTIQINPDLFKVPEKKTRKREPKGSGSNPRLEMKTDLKRQKQKSLRKNVLKMIREKQQEEYKKLFGNKPQTAGEEVSTSLGAQTLFNKDFDDSLDFFSSLAKKPENQETHDYTLKRYPNQQPNSVLLQPNMSIPSTTAYAAPAAAVSPTQINPGITSGIASGMTREPPIEMFSDTPYVVKPYIPPPPPTYGCLKNGTLPTYRTLKQRMYPSASAAHAIGPSATPSASLSATSSAYAGPSASPSATHAPMLSSYGGPVQPATASMQPNIYNSVRPTTAYTPSAPSAYAPPSFMSSRVNADGSAPGSGPGSLTASEIAQKYQKQTEKTNLTSNKNKLKYLKQKKIFKRTYRVGRSKVAPRIGVLVSNRTIRNRISTQSQLLKQTPIQEVRKFLIKKGFIKIGSNAPNNVLRKMYESVSLVCGEVENHNPDTLLFNFLNDSHP
jgi:hypothetical protein